MPPITDVGNRANNSATFNVKLQVVVLFIRSLLLTSSQTSRATGIAHLQQSSGVLGIVVVDTLSSFSH